MKAVKLPDWLRWLSGCVLTALASGMLLLAAGSYYYGSVRDAWAYARGERVVVSPATVRFSPGPPGKPHQVSCRVKNLGTEPVQLIGTSACCECAVTKGLGVRIAPGASENIEFTFLNRTPVPRYSKVVSIYTDNGRAPELRVRLESVESSRPATTGL